MTDSSPPRVSVVIPVYNGLRFLPRAVASVENQTHRPIQLVLVDGGSTDGSREWIRNYAKSHEVDVDFLPQGSSAATTWTRATELAAGEFITLLCQDDVLYPHALTSQVAAIGDFPDAVLVSARRDICDRNGRVIWRSHGGQGLGPGLHLGSDLIYRSYVRGVNIFGEPLAVMFRRKVLERHLPWNDDRPFMLDLEMYTRVVGSSCGVLSSATVGAYRVSSDSWSTQLASDQSRQFREWQRQATEYLPTSPSRLLRLRAAVNQHLRAWSRRSAYSWLRLTHRL